MEPMVPKLYYRGVGQAEPRQRGAVFAAAWPTLSLLDPQITSPIR